MGAIQDSLNQVANTALGAAVAATASKMVQEQQAEQKFNAEMKQAELPVQQAKNKIDEYEAKGKKEIEDLRIDRDKKITEVRDKNSLKNNEDDPFWDPNEAEANIKKAKKKIMKDYKAKARAKYLEQQYSTEKIKLARNLQEAQIKAKEQQGQLIAARLEQLRGGKK